MKIVLTSLLMNEFKFRVQIPLKNKSQSYKVPAKRNVIAKTNWREGEELLGTELYRANFKQF